VSVIAAFREMRAEPRLAMVVESESLLNDAVAAVGFVVLVGIAGGQSPTLAATVPALVFTALIGLIAGVVAAAVAMLLAYNTRDTLVEITITVIAAYGSFWIAEYFGGSGVLAAMTAGLLFGNIGWSRVLTDTGCREVDDAWDFFAFLANSFVFILIGLNTATQSLLARDILALGIVVVLVLASRLISIYPLALAFRPTKLRLPASYQLVLVWGGLRGALALALALAVPDSVPERDQIIAAAFAVVAFSILVQGLTMPPLLRWLGVTRPEDPGTA